MEGGMHLSRANDDLQSRFAFLPDKRCRVIKGQDYISVKGGFFQEGDGYNIFASYKKCDHDCAVAELPDSMKEEWYKRYFIAEEKMPRVVTETLKTVLETNIGTIEQRNGYTFRFPNCHKDNMEYDENSKVYLLLAGRNKRRSFQNRGQLNAATRTAWAIPKLRESLHSGREMSQRTLLYLNKRLYLDQAKSDGIINDLCCMTGCRRKSLNVVPAERGVVMGNILLRMKGGNNVSCSLGTPIPRKPELIQDVVVHEDAGDIEYILVVEKYTMMTYLEEMDYHNKHHCIILTGLGMPSISTRQFLKWLKDHTGLPVYGLCDPDPEGIEIISVYARGSVNAAFDNFNISVPSIRWIGLSTLDLDDYGLKLPGFCFADLTDLDTTTLSNICSDTMSNEWQRRIRHM
ncbi:meiotic recombination protein SPO11-4 [Triticum aestivum]|uniref:meiotic recombination protein SPO11-4 n=1 Tax=Triticum aestivum TaxID=4565 RepID=UPI000842F4AF|nr:meiotic recombination protein SPO11-4-like [Triticum aestivum]